LYVAPAVDVAAAAVVVVIFATPPSPPPPSLSIVFAITTTAVSAHLLLPLLVDCFLAAVTTDFVVIAIVPAPLPPLSLSSLPTLPAYHCCF
jgi:hypothetical protein